MSRLLIPIDLCPDIGPCVLSLGSGCSASPEPHYSSCFLTDGFVDTAQFVSSATVFALLLDFRFFSIVYVVTCALRPLRSRVCAALVLHHDVCRLTLALAIDVNAAMGIVFQLPLSSDVALQRVICGSPLSDLLLAVDHHASRNAGGRGHLLSHCGSAG